MRDKQPFSQRLPLIFSLLMVVGSVLMIHYLGHLTEKDNTILSQYRPNQSVSEPREPLPEKPIPEEITTTQEEIVNFNQLLASLKDQNPSKDQLLAKVQTILKADYKGDLATAQDDILSAIDQQGLDASQLGEYFIPDHPAQVTGSADSQMDVPLYLQKSSQYGPLAYGSNGSQTLAENGCAIVSLAMIDSYIKGSKIEPTDVLEWAGQTYYNHNQGTSWQIFYDYALDHDLLYENFGNRFDQAMQAVQEGRVVIASVQPGFFTEVGHILVIRGYENGKVYVNDPNDDPQKMHSIQPIDEAIFYQEGLNYWAYQ